MFRLMMVRSCRQAGLGGSVIGSSGSRGRRLYSIASNSTVQSPGASVPPPSPPPPRKERQEGDIGSVFASLSGEAETPLPARFLELKRAIIGDEANQQRLLRGWSTLTDRLRQLVPLVEARQQECIPVTSYEELVEAPPKDLVRRIKECGTVIVREVVSEDQALRWLDELRQYIAKNPSVKGFPADDKQVFELYWSKPQLAARAHPRSLTIQRTLLSLFSNTSPTTSASTSSLLTYADRLRIRHPGDARFALGPHMDGGSVERWEDATYREVYASILQGDWEAFDAWDMTTRAEVNQNMYDGAGACGVFRAFQGWTSLSHTGPGEGTLRVFPFLKEMTAYTLLRPLFREVQPRSDVSREAYLSSSNWVLDTETPRFPGSPLARGQEFNDATHPHLELDRTMVSIPSVRPGDQAWWHCDVIHAVEAAHRGTGPSAVMYIPSVPLTPKNAAYVRDQREAFLSGRPAPDFPGGVGESLFEGRGTSEDVVEDVGRKAMGLEPFGLDDNPSASERSVRDRANAALGF